jgi:sulfur carrier protein
VGIYMNGATREIPVGCTVAGLLSILEVEGRVAVAINRDVVPRSVHAEIELNDGDEVEILEAVGGG